MLRALISGYMSSSGVADCSRAARLVLKDVVNGKIKWIAAPPNMDQKKFDKLTYDVLDEVNSWKPNSGIMQQVRHVRSAIPSYTLHNICKYKHL